MNLFLSQWASEKKKKKKGGMGRRERTKGAVLKRCYSSFTRWKDRDSGRRWRSFLFNAISRAAQITLFDDKLFLLPGAIARITHTHTQTYVCSFQSRFLFAARQGGRMLLWRKSSYRRRPLIVVVFFLCCCYIPFRLFRLLILGWEWRWPQDLRWLKLIRCVNGP